MVNRTVVGGNQIPMLRHTLQKKKKKKITLVLLLRLNRKE